MGRISNIAERPQYSQRASLECHFPNLQSPDLERDTITYRSLGLNQNCCPSRRGDSHAATTSRGGSRACHRPPESRPAAAASPPPPPPCRPPVRPDTTKSRAPKTAKLCLPPLFTRPSRTPRNPPEPPSGWGGLPPGSCFRGRGRGLRRRAARSFLQVRCVRLAAVCAWPDHGQPGTASLAPRLLPPVQALQPIPVS